MIVIQGYLKTGTENVARLKEAAALLMAATRREPGCIAYAFAEDITEPGLIHIIERWSDEAALAAHNKTPHLAAFMGVLPGLGLSGVRIASYDTTAEKVLVGA